MSLKVTYLSYQDGTIILILISTNNLGLKTKNIYFSKLIENTETSGFKFQSDSREGKYFLMVELTTR